MLKDGGKTVQAATPKRTKHLARAKENFFMNPLQQISKFLRHLLPTGIYIFCGHWSSKTSGRKQRRALVEIFESLGFACTPSPIKDFRHYPEGFFPEGVLRDFYFEGETVRTVSISKPAGR